MYYIGIDPGLSGAISILDVHGLLEIIDMPTIEYQKGKKKKRDYDSKAIKNIIKTTTPPNQTIIFIEKMQSLPPGIRIQATAGIMYCQGLMEGICLTLDIPYEIIKPKDWQKPFEITSSKGDTKAQSYQVASRLFPTADLTGPRGGRKDGRSDSLLIAEFGRRKCTGGIDG